MTRGSQASNGVARTAEQETLSRLAQSLSPQQWSWLNALDPNFLFSALQSRTSVADCQISDISATGCKLKVQSSAHIPNRFTLNFNASNISRQCEISWRNEHAMGVLFLNDLLPV